jgi:hypothetical protein
MPSRCQTGPPARPGAQVPGHAGPQRGRVDGRPSTSRPRLASEDHTDCRRRRLRKGCCLATPTCPRAKCWAWPFRGSSSQWNERPNQSSDKGPCFVAERGGRTRTPPRLDPPCGAQGQACCFSSKPCFGVLTCQSNSCQPPPSCGALGQTCCTSGVSCSGTLTCQANSCLQCVPNSTRCSSLNPYTPDRCRSDGSGWDLQPECGYLCGPTSGTCCGNLGEQCCSIPNTSPCANPSVVHCVNSICRIQ